MNASSEAEPAPVSSRAAGVIPPAASQNFSKLRLYNAFPRMVA